jgi:intergrase/recombinase
MAKDKKKLENYATKTNPKAIVKTTITIKSLKLAKAKYCSLLDCEQFKKARAVKASSTQTLKDRLSEDATKRGLAKLLGELNVAKDWGGELADIISGRMRVRGKSQAVAFALKGPAKTGPLFPGKMGKNGDQIQRLFRAPVRYHFVQYEGLIDSSVTEQMQQLARAKSLMGEDIYYGVIDDVDTKKIRIAYPQAFK